MLENWYITVVLIELHLRIPTLHTHPLLPNNVKITECLSCLRPSPPSPSHPIILPRHPWRYPPFLPTPPTPFYLTCVKTHKILSVYRVYVTTHPILSFPDTPGVTHRECGRTSTVQEKGGRKEVQLEPWRYVGMTDSVLAWQYVGMSVLA